MSKGRDKGGLGEFEIIARYFTRPASDPDVLVGIGDDAAVVRSNLPLAVATDTLVAGVHFPAAMPPRSIGYRALAVNLSDLAAMGARPRWCTLALTLEDASDTWLAAFAEGLLGLAVEHSVELIGGDITRGPLTVSVHILGTLEPDGVLLRSGATLGDDIYVTGTLGGAAAGLLLLQRGQRSGRVAESLIEKFERPIPRVAAGLALREIAGAAIDISDGLVADLGHICEQSGCGAAIELERVPLPPGLDELFGPEQMLDFALRGGDDYELCFTAAPARAGLVERAFADLGIEVLRIGRIVAGTRVVAASTGRALDAVRGGYTHF